jgi:hypothetical protein
MHKLLALLLAHVPSDFRILFRQFLLRVVDFDALSIQADVAGYLGQFAGVLMMFSLIHVPFILSVFGMAPWYVEHYLIATMMLVAGLIAVITWDAIFPDLRDVMVLSPLPIAPHTILLAKVTSSSALMGLAILALNFASSLMLSAFAGAMPGNHWGFLQALAAYWFTMAAASGFLYCSILTVQGFSALLLPRRIFLRLSAILQLAAFGIFLGVYFLEPSIETPAGLAAHHNQWLLACSPDFWFFALFNQLNGSLPSTLTWLAWRAWIGLGIVLSGSAASLILCYLRTMKKIVEEPDLVPGSGRIHWTPRFGNALQTALTLFSARSLWRSRQHRVAFAFFLAVVFAIALSWLRGELSGATRGSMPDGFILSTFIMMSVAVFALRSVFSLPISLTANWVLRTTQLSPSEKYIAVTRTILLCFSVVPVWLVSAFLSLAFRPWHQVTAHLAVLALLGWILAEINLIGFYKVPFTCSYLPGKSNIQFIFWGFVIFIITVALPAAEFELGSFNGPFRYVCMMVVLSGAAIWLWAFNRRRASAAILYFEELPTELITTLKLVSY